MEERTGDGEGIRNTAGERNYGIDFFRMLSMLMVLVLHVLGYGGILRNAAALSVNYEAAWLLNILAYGAVNCYALISGYVGVGSTYKSHKIVMLWLQVVFYTLFITLAFFILVPDAVVGGKPWEMAMLPVLFDQYWYFTAYFCMFFFIPVLNYLLHTLDKKEMVKLLLATVLLFSIYPTIRGDDIFGTRSGYSVLWLAVLYLIGGYIKKYRLADGIGRKKAMLTFLGCVFVTWGSKFILEYSSFYKSGEVTGWNYLVSYVSPTILLGAIALLLFFANSPMRGKRTSRLIRLFAPAAFSIYLIHLHPLCIDNLLLNRFISFADKPVLQMVADIGVVVGTVYVVCSLADMVRIKMFKLLRIEQFSKWIVKMAAQILSRCVNRYHRSENKKICVLQGENLTEQNQEVL